jgi:dCTP diphosphatase
MKSDERFDLRVAHQAVQELVRERGWESYHRPRYLVSALATEVAELLDLTLWKSPREVDDLFVNQARLVRDEVADVLINLLSLIDFSDLDPNDAVAEKVAELLNRHSNTPYGESRGERGSCAECGNMLEMTWLWCPKCGAPAETAVEPIRPITEHPGGAVRYDLDRWDAVAKLLWANRAQNQRWVHDFILIPTIRSLIAPTDHSVLDVGCGDGYLSEQLRSELALDVLAYDAAPQMRQLASQALGSSAVLASLKEVPHGTVQLAVANLVLQSVAEPAVLLKDVREVLRSGARLIVTVPHPCFTLIRDLHTTTVRRWLEPPERRLPSAAEGLQDLARYYEQPVEEVVWSTALGVSTLLYNRTLQQYLEIFSAGGFVVKNLLEPSPIGADAKQDARLFSLFSAIPGFLCFVLEAEK